MILLSVAATDASPFRKVADMKHGGIPIADVSQRTLKSDNASFRRLSLLTPTDHVLSRPPHASALTRSLWCRSWREPPHENRSREYAKRAESGSVMHDEC